MKYERYVDLTVTEDFMEYEFTSTGPKGNIVKIVQFSQTEREGLINLAFGNKLKDGSIDDLARDHNGDRNKILATVVTVLKTYFKVYPFNWVFFAGSSSARTRLYRMAITLNFEELEAEFEILGVLEEFNFFPNVPFAKGIDYFGFLVRPKKLKFDI